MKVLIVDDQRSARRVLQRMLAEMPGLVVEEAASAEEALKACEGLRPDLVLLDIRLADDPRDRAGLDVLRRLRASGNGVPVVMVTSLTEVTEIREAMRCGAQDYVFKDELAPEMLLPVVQSIKERLSMRSEIVQLRERVDRTWGLSAIVGSSQSIERLRKTISRLAAADAAVLIRGETGTGKELVARALHHMSPRATEPFLAVNCSALPGTLIESLLFGHQKGAFTGADRRVRGQFELAGSGTLLLDEIAEMPGELQAKLLRVLEDRKFRPLGSEIELPLRARVLAATHVDLEERIREGKFRRDLYYRLSVLSIQVPPLSERTEDIPELLMSFAADRGVQLQLTEEAILWLLRRPWPGNVRELRNLVERIALLAGTDRVSVPDLEELSGSHGQNTSSEVDRLARALLALPDDLGSRLRVMERAVLQHAVETCGGNKSAAARLIGIDRKALERRWERMNDGASGSDELD
ncbi:MAG: sigma-54-dependent Fis family transcriptional regulator [Deltaproteobacteria bacterium]|nr:sigma-54-dependent Fis family transcriptional regulator [Deltaproteobacteria bacterium]